MGNKTASLTKQQEQIIDELVCCGTKYMTLDMPRRSGKTTIIAGYIAQMLNQAMAVYSFETTRMNVISVLLLSNSFSQGVDVIKHVEDTLGICNFREVSLNEDTGRFTRYYIIGEKTLRPFTLILDWARPAPGMTYVADYIIVDQLPSHIGTFVLPDIIACAFFKKMLLAGTFGNVNDSRELIIKKGGEVPDHTLFSYPLLI